MLNRHIFCFLPIILLAAMLWLRPSPEYLKTVFASRQRVHSTALKAGTQTALPAPWKQRDIGKLSVAGQCSFSAEQFIIKGSGIYKDSTTHQCQFAYFPAEAETEITVRVQLQKGSQLSRIGLMIRESLLPHSRQVSALIIAGRQGEAGASKWQVVQFSRSGNSLPLKAKHFGIRLPDPPVVDDSSTGYCWLRLQRRFNSFTAFTSEDGRSWTSMGSSFVEMNKKFFTGITVSSGFKDKMATAVFDHISIPGWSSE